MASLPKGLEHLVEEHPKLAATLFFVISVAALVLAAVFYATRNLRESRLSALLIKQMECTHEVERRSQNKSAAFANASHDMRGALGCLTTLIELCYDLVPSGSEVEYRLRQMHHCADDLTELLNSILDTSKLEAGKLELEDGEFNLAHLLEEVADFYHPTALKKGVEVVLDPCDDSVSKLANVRGDRIRVKQIISSLVSNAVKFTPKGSISIRAWARPSTLQTSILVSHHNTCRLNWFSRVLLKDEDNKGLETPQQNPSCIEYIIEVDDTGKGIAKDKQKLVFEKNVQVKDSSLGHGGTGLGLGIVQSLVRLMGGDICIVDKEPGKKGTCFKFNIFLNQQAAGIGHERVRDAADDVVDIESPAESMEMVSDVPHRHKVDGLSLVVLLIHNHERRQVVKRYLKRLGVKMSIVKHWEYLQGRLRRMKTKMSLSQNNKNSSISDWTSSQSECISGRSASGKFGKEVPLSCLDGMGQSSRSGVNNGAPTFIMFLIDVSVGPPAELAAVVEEFRRDLSSTVLSKVVWLEKVAEGCNGLVERLWPEDVILSEPLHGSKLHQVVKIMPEFGGFSTVGRVNGRAKGRAVLQLEDSEIRQEDYRSSSGWQEIMSNKERRERVDEDPCSETAGLSGDKQLPLTGLNVLVAEDTPLLADLARSLLSKLGAFVHVCENGKQALEVAVQGLRELGSSKRMLFDLILMDCEMPEMNGFEATREIRKAEQPYNVRIPILALTAHSSRDQIKETRLAGMDGHLAKPIKQQALVETITRICRPEMG